MKKRFLLLSLVALGTVGLSGCGDKEEEVDYLSQVVPQEFKGHKLVGKPVDGKSYYFGFYNRTIDVMRFISGDYHSDSKGKYPFYIATVEDTLTGAATVTVNYVDDEHFTIKVNTEDEDLPWHNKYMSLYSAVSSYSNYVWSLAPVENFTDQYETKDGDLVDVIGNFQYIESFEDFGICGVGMMIQDDREEVAEEYEIPRVLGGGDEYISLDCSHFDKLNIEEQPYGIAHFYEI